MRSKFGWLLALVIAVIPAVAGADLLHESEAVLISHNLHMLLASLMLAILLWVLTDFFAHRESLVGWFALVQAIQVVLSLVLLEHLPFDWLKGDGVHWRVAFAFSASLLATSLFNRYLIRLYKPSRVAMRALDVVIILCALQFLVLFIGQSREAMWMGIMATGLQVGVLPWLAYSARQDGLPGLLTLRVTYLALGLGMLGVLFILLSDPHTLVSYRNATVMEGLVSAVLISLFLFRRSYALGEQEIENRLRFQRIEQGLKDHEFKIDEQRRFMDMLSHELKTPLSVIQITLDTLSVPQRSRDRIQKALRTMLDVIDRCRLSTQIDEQRTQFMSEPFDLGELVEEVVDSCVSPSRVMLNVDAIMVETDRQLLGVIVQNLVDNALKYSPDGSVVEVAINADEDRFSSGVTLVVRNELQSGPLPDAEQIFRKYVRGAASGAQSGSGLGLHLCRQISEMLDASLSCQVLNKAVVFVLWLPEHVVVQTPAD